MKITGRGPKFLPARSCPPSTPDGSENQDSGHLVATPESCSHLIAFFPSGVDFLLLCFMHCAWFPKANHYSAVTYMEADMAAEMHTKGLGL
jgi:hypothetical protein